MAYNINEIVKYFDNNFLKLLSYKIIKEFINYRIDKGIITETYINICKDIYHNTQIIDEFSKDNNIETNMKYYYPIENIEFNTINIFKEKKI